MIEEEQILRNLITYEPAGLFYILSSTEMTLSDGDSPTPGRDAMRAGHVEV